MRKIRLMLASLLGLAMTMALPSAKADDVLRVATEGAYPPFNWIDSDGSVKGFDVDMTYALCEKIGRECELVVQDWEGMIPGLLAKKYDIIIASMSITDERKKKVDFTGKYYQTPDRFVARKGSGLEVTAEGLNGKRIGVQRATTQHCYLDKFHSDAEIVLYAVQEDGYSDLASGRIVAYVADGIQIEEALLKSEGGDDFELIGSVLDDAGCLGEGAGIALRKGNEELRDQLTQAIQDMRADGTYKSINDKYFSFDVYGAEPN
ncbi:MAG: transporter substrate-binding domain-containing protein [Pseudomonadota bacterium]